MNKQRYIVARYIPDLRRNEPRNVGVMLWTKSRVGYRFLPTEHATTLGADEKTYSRWVNFWSATCDASEIDLGRDGKVLARKTSDFMDAILDTQRGNFQLVDLGFVAENIAKQDVDLVVSKLFTDLIELYPEELPSRKPVWRRFASLCKEMFDTVGLLSDPEFVHTVPSHIPCKIGKAYRKFPINYRLGSEAHPNALFHRVNLADERSVDAASYMFEKLVVAGVVGGQQRCGALISTAPDVEPIDGAQLQLSQHCIPIDIAGDRDAAELVAEVAYGKAA